MRGSAIEAAIAALAKDFAEAGRILDVDRAAFGLAMAHPDSALTTEEIRLCIIEAAQQCGTAMLVESAESPSIAGPATPPLASPAPSRPKSSRPSASRLRQLLLQSAAFGGSAHLVPPV